MSGTATRAFGPFALDSSRGLLFAGARNLALTTRGVTLLETLLDADGDAVEKTALLQRVWPGAIVEEGNLAVQIATLRRQFDVLVPDGRDWIATVPRVGYRLIAPTNAPQDGRPVLAVLPFDNLSDDPDQDYFASGLVEELITALSRFRSFAVVALNSTGTGADYVLRGSVRRAGRRLRVATHLVAGADGRELWAERFDGDVADIFDVEDKITEAVVGVVEPQIRRAEIERARRRRPDSLGAYDHYLRALPYLYAPQPDAWTTALPILESAIALDPGFAPAMAAAAWTHEKRIRQYMPAHGPDDKAAALSLARRAVAADDTDATVLAIGGWVPIAINGEFETGLVLARRALKMNPNNLVVLNLAAASNVFAGDLDEAEACYFRAYQLSPGAPDAYWALTGLGQVHLLSGEFDEAIDWLERSLAVNDGFPMTLGTLAASLALAGRLEEARPMMARLLAVKPHMTLDRMAARIIRDRLRWRNSVEGLRLAGMPEGAL